MAKVLPVGRGTCTKAHSSWVLVVLVMGCLGCTPPAQAESAADATDSSATKQLEGGSSGSAPSVPTVAAAETPSGLPNALTPSNQELASEFAARLSNSTSQTVAKWAGSSNIKIYLQLTAPKHLPKDDTADRIGTIARQRLKKFEQLTGFSFEFVPSTSEANFHLGLYGSQVDGNRGIMVGHAQWVETRAKQMRNWIYGGVAAVKLDGQYIEAASCAVTYHLNGGHYFADLMARHLRAAGISPFRDKDRIQRNTDDRVSRIVEKKFDPQSACVRRDYIARWSKIVDSCAAAMFGLHPAPNKSDNRDRPTYYRHVVSDQLYWNDRYELYERYWPLFLRVLYSNEIFAGMSYREAEAIALREIAKYRADFETQADKSDVGCMGVP